MGQRLQRLGACSGQMVTCVSLPPPQESHGLGAESAGPEPELENELDLPDDMNLDGDESEKEGEGEAEGEGEQGDKGSDAEGVVLGRKRLCCWLGAVLDD